MNASRKQGAEDGLEVGRRGPGWIGVVLVATALLSALGTFLMVAGFAPVAPTLDLARWAMPVNLALVLALAALVAWQSYKLVKARRAGAAGARLHVRFVVLFSLIATLPAILVAVVASITLARGLDPWFTGWINRLMVNTVEIAHAYRDLQCRTLARETNLMAADLNRARVLFDADRGVFREFMKSRAMFLGFPIAMIVDANGSVVERIENKAIPDLEGPTPGDFAAAGDQDALCLIPRNDNVLRAVLRLQAHDGNYLFVTRIVDRRALDFPREAEAGIAYYKGLEQTSTTIQVAFALMFALVSLILLLSAIWFGLGFATWLVAPIRRLIHATNQVATGNFYVQVPVRRDEGDLAHLGETFNKMTAELRRQHDGLVAASDLMDRRRRFTEAVLSGVSAGVIGIDAHGVITIVNPSAEALFGATRDELVGRPLAEVLPEIAPLVADARHLRQRLMQTQISLTRNGRDRTVDVRVTSEQARSDDKGLVITLDDITNLVSAQRTSAWADVARRIAHEIKNPLTPIQLAAERIRRKYGKVIVEDRDVFDQCTATIVRQVDDIKRMVDEFSSFARMPKPAIGEENLADTVRQVVFMMRIGHPDVTFEEEIPEGAVMASFDRRLVSQAVTNIVKNAAEGIAALAEEERTEGGRVRVRVAVEGGRAVIEVIDNGRGFPVENRQRLLEPYMTTREGGTGLGLPIVGKIFEEHGGGIELLDNPQGRGALVRLWFPLRPSPAEPAAAPVSDRAIA